MYRSLYKKFCVNHAFEADRTINSIAAANAVNAYIAFRFLPQMKYGDTTNIGTNSVRTEKSDGDGTSIEQKRMLDKV